jgi:hypothetical protein
MTNHEENDDRRQLLIRVGRYAMLGGISVLSLNLFNRVLGSGCVQLQSPCQTCGLFKRCELPKAEASQQQLGEEETS